MKSLSPRKSLRELLQRVLSMGNHPSACCTHDNDNDDSRRGDRVPSSGCLAVPPPIPPGFVLLHGCRTMEQHERKVRDDGEAVVRLSSSSSGGEERLLALGFRFRFVPCCRHASRGCSVEDYGRELREDEVADHRDDWLSRKEEVLHEAASGKKVRFDFSSSSNHNNDISRIGWHDCKDCVTRLFYVGTEKDDEARKDWETSAPGNAFVGQSLAGQPSSCEDGQFQGHENDDAFDAYAAVHSSDKDMNHTQKLECDDSTSSTTAQHCDKMHNNTNDTMTVDNTPQTQQNPTPITPANRQTYIADGKHYELITKLAQEAAHDIMTRTFDLEWITICNDACHEEHVRALVDIHHRLRFLQDGEGREVVEELLGACRHFHDDEDEKKEKEESVLLEEQQLTNIHGTIESTSTLLIATGRGKVRAGIFSRFHLLTAGIEVGTAWHNIREARMRDMGVVIIDPNARGEQEGMETFKRSLRGLFTRAVGKIRHGGERNASPTTLSTEQEQESKELLTSSSSSSPLNPASSIPTSSIYILAHSASGGQLVRHLREDPSLLPSIRAIAFTDSTHNVQWCKDDPSLMNFLSTNHCIYLRSNDVRSSQSCIHVSSRGKDIACQCINCTHNRKNAGVVADTDSFWEHRFGKIRTLWAGTADHALSNWAGHDHIWLHFDRHSAKWRDELNKVGDGS
ncbi:hypothetical protein ACHAW6_005082 [Cyclotella cf. meneghiniana]